MYLKKYERRECESFTGIGMGGMFNVGVVEWQHGFAGTQSSLLAVFLDFKSYKEYTNISYTK